MLADLTEKLKSEWWYYNVQLKDGTVVKSGIYPDGYPYPPRILQRRVKFAGMDCLDIGSAEGLLPILAKKAGARSVIATDYGSENLEKLSYLAECHEAEVAFRPIGRAQNVDCLLGEFSTGFDYINLSGVLYHVTSPLDTLIAARRLLRPNGLMMVSTICSFSDKATMEFNAAGHLQPDRNTFWYLSLGFFDYMLRLLCLSAIDVVFFSSKHEAGYVSLLCRAVEQPCASKDDQYMAACLAHSPELEHRRRKVRLRASAIEPKGQRLAEKPVYHPDGRSLHLYETVMSHKSVDRPVKSSQDSRLFLLSDVD